LAISHQDLAYPVLVATILPPWLTGFFAAVMFGAIISSFNGGLNSVTALFSMDLYKPLIRKQASNAEVVKAGRIFGITLIIISIIIAPQIAKAPDGLYTLMRKLMAFFNIPILAIVLLGVLSKRAQALSAYIAVPIGIVFYYWASMVMDGKLFGHQFHWLHVAGINLVLIMSIMYIIRLIKPRKEAYVQASSGEVDITFWKGAKAAGIAIVLLIVGIYWLLNKLF